MKAKAYAPSHVTGFFRILKDHAVGAGFNIDKGSTTEAEIAEGEGVKIFINSEEKTEEAKVSRNVINRILNLPQLKAKKYEIKINHQIEVPIGYGLGTSGSGTYSLSLALNKALETQLSHLECREIARLAEIEEGTGLATVIAQTFKGLIMAKKPYEKREVHEITTNKTAVLAFFEPIETASIIRNPDWQKKINNEGEKCIEELEKEKTVEKFIELSRRFTLTTGLAGKGVRKIMEEIPEASMAMLGQTIFILTENPEETEKQLKEHTDKTIVSSLSSYGAKLL